VGFEDEDDVSNRSLTYGGPRQDSGRWRCKIMLAEITLQGASPHGHVKSGTLVLCGPVWPFPWFVPPETSPAIGKNSTQPSESLLHENSFQPKGFEIPDSAEDRDIRLDDKSHLPYDCVLIRLNDISGLLLELVKASSSGSVYRRIGLCTRRKGYRTSDVWLSSDGRHKETITIV
jgi:hypothetical protein